MNNTIYALGFFDGVHLGHQALLRRCGEIARQFGCASGAVTFAAHPDTLVTGSTPALICTQTDRDQLLGSCVDAVVSLPFDQKMLDTPWVDFLDFLRRDYGAAGFVCGDDFRFGRGGIGNPELLLSYCLQHEIPCAVVPEQSIHGVRISSFHIRQLLESGQIEQANQFLGHPWQLTGTVVHGKQLGRTLGIPTANLLLPKDMVVPRFGVYACQVTLDSIAYPAVTNIGTRPTVTGKGITVEPWILHYSGDLYGQELTLEFHRFLRPEVKFPDLSALKAEITRNAEQTQAYFDSLVSIQPIHNSFTCVADENRV